MEREENDRRDKEINGVEVGIDLLVVVEPRNEGEESDRMSGSDCGGGRNM